MEMVLLWRGCVGFIEVLGVWFMSAGQAKENGFDSFSE